MDSPRWHSGCVAEPAIRTAKSWRGGNPSAVLNKSLTITDASGNRVRAVDLRGRWLLIFFGYTFCPDLCPTTLSEIAGALAQLGPLAAQVQPVFVSIDPQREAFHYFPP
jgi:protein SCO1/2